MDLSSPPFLIPELDEKKHKYTLQGKPAPGVTSVFQSCGIGVNTFWTVEGREFGRAVHTAIHFYAQNDLDESTLHESIKPRLDAYISFCLDHNFKPDLIEQKMGHPTLKYCGTVDQVETGRLIVDFKCGQHLPEHALQMAAYAHCLPNPLLYDRWGVQLLETGKYKLQPYKKQDCQRDFNIFLCCLNIQNWRKTNGNTK